jgi:acetyl-CoA carboxylase beta subunit
VTRPVVRTADAPGAARGGRTPGGRLRNRSREAKRTKCRECGDLFYGLTIEGPTWTCPICRKRSEPEARVRARSEADCGACGRAVRRLEGTWHHVEEDRDEGHEPMWVTTAV